MDHHYYDNNTSYNNSFNKSSRYHYGSGAAKNNDYSYYNDRSGVYGKNPKFANYYTTSSKPYYQGQGGNNFGGFNKGGNKGNYYNTGQNFGGKDFISQKRQQAMYNNSYYNDYNDNSYYSFHNESNISFKKKGGHKSRYYEEEYEGYNDYDLHHDIPEQIFVNSYTLQPQDYQEQNKVEITVTNLEGQREDNKEKERERDRGNELKIAIKDESIITSGKNPLASKGFSNQHAQMDYNDEYNDEYESKREEQCILEYINYVNEKYPNQVRLNETNKGITNKVKAQKEPRFFVIKSFTEEDIHKSIKYNCWSSTKEGNKKLDKAYVDALEKQSDILLFFSMNTSGRFTGAARISGRLEENFEFEYWAVDEIWKGLFPVEWLIIKDIPNKALLDIKLSNNSNKPVTNSRDTQEIPRPEGEEMLKIFEEYNNTTNILQHFKYYDERQELYEKSRK